MQSRCTLAFIVVLITAAPVAALECPVAERPTWALGTTWKYDGEDRSGKWKTTRTYLGIVEEGGSKYHLWQSGAWKRYFDENLNQVIAKNPQGEAVNVAKPSLEMYRWPLKAGMRWTQWVEHTVRGKTSTYEQELRVSCEEVTVLAGTFTALKVRRQIFRSSTWEEIWYVPEVQSAVKRRGDSQGDGAYEELLTSWEPKAR